MIESYSMLLHFEAFRHKKHRYPIHLRFQDLYSMHAETVNRDLGYMTQ